MNPHQIVDLIVLAILLYCMVKGASRGLLSQLAWVVALLLCFKFSGTLAPAIEPLIGVDPPLKQWIAMLAVYVGLCGLSFVAAGMLSSWMEKAKVIDFDKHLGGVLGLVKGIVICMTAMFFAITMSEPMRQIVSKTYSGYAAAVILHNSQYLIPLLPENTVARVQNVIDEFNRRLQPGVDDFKGATPASPDAFGSDSLAETDASNSGDGLDLLDLIQGKKNGSRPAEASNTEPPSLSDLLSQLPSDLRGKLTERAYDMLENSTPEEKQQLMEQLSSSVPKNAGAILTEFFRGNSSSTGQGSGISNSSPSASPIAKTQLGQRESALLNEIAGIYDRRTDIVSNTKSYLAGVPSQVQQKVLADWHADAMGLSADPDPTTNFDTPLDVRIVRQLNKAGISLDRLDRELRTRLSEISGSYR